MRRRCLRPSLPACLWLACGANTRSAVARDLLKYERTLWRSNITLVAGTDEAGRGPLAGPVTAAAVIFPNQWLERGLPRALRGLNDSKQLTEEAREYYFAKIIARPEIQYSVADVPVETIDSI